VSVLPAEFRKSPPSILLAKNKSAPQGRSSGYWALSAIVRPPVRTLRCVTLFHLTGISMFIIIIIIIIIIISVIIIISIISSIIIGLGLMGAGPI
jgi:hypothetical protein